jgi:predicted acylesterase/phospholipase RssA
LDIIAGTSIGGVNAVIISGSKNEKPAKAARRILVRNWRKFYKDRHYFNASSLFMDYYSSLSYLPTIIYTIVSYVIFNFQNYNCVL